MEWATWRQCAPHELGTGHADVRLGRQWMFYTRRFHGRLVVGITVFGSLTVRELSNLHELWTSVSATATSVTVVIDLLRASIVVAERGGLISDLANALHATRARADRRLVILVQADWSYYFWRGLIDSYASSALVVGTPVEVAAALGETWSSIRSAVEPLDAAVASASPVTREVTQLLVDDPSLELEALARSLGCSERSIQRALTDDGYRFARVRDAARLRAADAMLSAGHKLQEVCQRVGLATPSYFISWYKRVRGLTPGLGRVAGTESGP